MGRSNKRRVAIAGTGHRGAGTWGQDLFRTVGDRVELTGLFDSNPLRLAAVAGMVGDGCVATTDFDDLIARARPDTLLVATRDDTHVDFIVAALDAGIDVITEKPMATSAEACRRILAAEARTGRRVAVAFNYRFAPTSRKIRELLASGRIGTIASADFHWYLDTQHGADYFRRWHAFRRFSGSLFVHKSTHHFDLLNWFLDSDPDTVFATGSLRRYGAAGPFRSVRCKGCPHAGECDFYFDISADPWLDTLYEAPAAADGYLRDACVFREDIDIWDTMAATIAYANGVMVSYSLNTFMPIEGYHLAFNGTKGRIEVRMYERQAFARPEGVDEIVVLGIDRSVERIRVEHGPGGHFGGDPLLHLALFDPELPDNLGQRAGARAGALSVLIGVAAAQSVDTGRPVAVRPLLEADGPRPAGAGPGA